ncbi:MAG: hypothetical protein GF317_08565 [Candidatus Lokiarchaeota archaeon]|nr:hypothetical protein [Candidatus Lokiarchaeota archaeon]MBD3199767.1 hypothetical protein [Candidatus Lokiarchaeota archaeon]
MPNYKNYKKRIIKYQKKLSRYQSRIRSGFDKLKNLALNIGISASSEFDLNDPNIRNLIFPCHLGIIFLGDFDVSIFNKLKDGLMRVYDSFFFDIQNLGEFNFPLELFSRGIKKESKEKRERFKKVKLHPTNKFYQTLIEKRNEHNLDMIIAITDLPLYSSSNQNIIFLFGEAHTKYRSCIVSTLKLRELYYERKKNEGLFENRLKKEVIHEIGHLILGVNHCEDLSCVMTFSNEIEGIDKKSMNLCRNCKEKLIKFRIKSNF